MNKFIIMVTIMALTGCHKSPPTAGCLPGANDKGLSPTTTTVPCPELKVEGGGVNEGKGPATSAEKGPDGDVVLE